jgi:hypothetical protein
MSMDIETYTFSGMHLASAFRLRSQYAPTGTQLKIPAKNQAIPCAVTELASGTRMEIGSTYPGNDKPHGELEGEAHSAHHEDPLVLEQDRHLYECEGNVVGNDYTAI